MVAQGSPAAMARPVDATEAAKVLAIARSVAEDAKRLQVQLAAARSERDDAQKARATLAQDAEALRLRLAAAALELAEARRAGAASTAAEEALRSQLETAHSELNRVQEERASATAEAEGLRSQLEVALRERAILAGDAEALRAQLRAGQERLAWPEVRDELEAAWKALVGGHLPRLRAALAVSGVRTSGAALANALPMAAAEVCRKSRETTKLLQGPAEEQRRERKVAASAEGRSERKGKKEKKRRTSSGAEAQSSSSSQLQNFWAKPQQDWQHTALARAETLVPTEQTALMSCSILPTKSRCASMCSASQVTAQVDVYLNASEELFNIGDPCNGRAALPHRTSRAGPSALRRRCARSQTKVRRICFADAESLTTRVEIASYRACGEQLWFSNPHANVMCGRCAGRFSQQLGRLHGGSGFSCYEFLCNDCSSNFS